MGKGARFEVFLLVLGIGVLGGNPWIAFDLVSFGGSNHSYGMPMRYSYYPHSFMQICGVNWEIGKDFCWS
jgi:hypothetical protein